MVIWGAIWGLILGFLWPGHDSHAQAVIGAVGGAVAGFSLRRVVRQEIEAQRASWPRTVPVAVPEAALVPASVGEPVARVHQEPPVPRTAPDLASEGMARVTADLPGDTPDLALVQESPATPAVPVRPDFATALFNQARAWLFGGNTIVRMGVLVLFVGLAFLAKYAIDNSLLPPELRLAGIALSGITLFAGGFWLRGRNPGRLAYALTLQGAGVAVLYLTVFAAFRLYQFLPSGAAFVLLGLICAFSAVIALAQNAMAMAFIGFAGGFAAPILVSSGEGNDVALFSYYLLLNLAIAAMAWARAWRHSICLDFSPPLVWPRLGERSSIGRSTLPARNRS